MSDILFLSLKDLLLTHSFSEITVQNIVDNCEVSRTTFYRCFKDKYELALYEYLQFLSKGMKKLKEKELGISQFTKDTLNYFYNKKEFYQKILQYTGQNSFEEQFRNEFIKQTTNYCKAKLNIENLPLELDFQVKFIAAAHTYLILNWVKNNCSLNIDAFCKLLMNSFPSKLQRLII